MITPATAQKRGETKPNAAAMAKIAKVLDTTVDFLMHGSVDDVTADAGLEKEIISRFKQVQELDKEDKKNGALSA